MIAHPCLSPASVHPSSVALPMAAEDLLPFLDLSHNIWQVEVPLPLLLHDRCLTSWFLVSTLEEIKFTDVSLTFIFCGTFVLATKQQNHLWLNLISSYGQNRFLSMHSGTHSTYHITNEKHLFCLKVFVGMGHSSHDLSFKIVLQNFSLIGLLCHCIELKVRGSSSSTIANYSDHLWPQ